MNSRVDSQFSASASARIAELAQLSGWAEPLRMPANVFIYAVAYRPARRQEANVIDVWPVPLTVGGPLPLLPLTLKRAAAVPLDLEATYHAACVARRIAS